LATRKKGEKAPRAGPIDTVTLLDIQGILGKMLRLAEEEKPRGIVEPLSLTTVTMHGVVLTPPFRERGKWFSVTIVKLDAVELNVVVNTGESSDTPYTMGIDENVYDQYFNRPCIYDVRLWTDSGTCRVKVRGSR